MDESTKKFDIKKVLVLIITLIVIAILFVLVVSQREKVPEKDPLEPVLQYSRQANEQEREKLMELLRKKQAGIDISNLGQTLEQTEDPDTGLPTT